MRPSRTHRPTLAIVCGHPGSGKTTLARLLAQAVPCPLISRDEINEGIFHTFDHDLGLASKDSVVKLAFDTFFQTINLLLSSNVTLVAEAAFQDRKWRDGLEPLITIADMKIVHCTVDPELAQRRIARRRLEQRDTPGAQRAARARQSRPLPPSGQAFQPLSLPVPSMHVTAADGYDPRLDEIVAFIRSRPAAATTRWDVDEG